MRFPRRPDVTYSARDRFTGFVRQKKCRTQFSADNAGDGQETTPHA